MSLDAIAVQERITAYLTGGGLFNPELANHDAVRALLIDARAALARVRDEALRSGWNAAIVLGHNICVQENDRINADDGSVEAMDALSECAKRIKDWAEPDDRQLAEMFGESEPALLAMKGKP